MYELIGIIESKVVLIHLSVIYRKSDDHLAGIHYDLQWGKVKFWNKIGSQMYQYNGKKEGDPIIWIAFIL